MALAIIVLLSSAGPANAATKVAGFGGDGQHRALGELRLRGCRLRFEARR